MDSAVKVSVLMMAFNHGPYIAQAVESVLMQRTGFKLEILVGEDCSTDSTRDILTGLAQQYPGGLNLQLNAENLGMHQNFDRLLGQCRGEYVAVLEGDDYWTSPQKLQKQAAFLDGHPDFSACFHNVQVVEGQSSTRPDLYCPDDQPAVTGFADLLNRNTIPTCSIVFRRAAVPSMPAWTKSLPMLDWALLALLARQGKIGYLPEVMGAYRIHAGGVWSNLGYLRKLTGSIQFLTALRDHSSSSERVLVAKALAAYWQEFSTELFDLVSPLPAVDEAVQRLDQELDRFPAGFDLPGAVRRKLYGRVYAAHGFRYFERRDYPKTLACWKNAVLNDLTWMKNPGVWSMGLRSLLAVR
ncbi:MAG TPA: glycosyltransferase [Anaerolineaceae bacterium]